MKAVAITRTSYTLRPLAACLILALTTAADADTWNAPVVVASTTSLPALMLPASTSPLSRRSLAALPATSLQTPTPRRSAQPATTLPVTTCSDDGSAGTLRSVVASATSGDTIDLSQLDCGTISLQDGQIEIDVNDLTVLGPGRDVMTIDGNHTGRIFSHIGTGTLTVNALSLQNGRADAAVSSNPSDRTMRGGCVFSLGNLEMTDASVSGCEAVNATGAGNSAVGGGLYARGTAELTGTTISNNTASGVAPAGGSASAVAGGVFALTQATLTESQITGNKAVTGGTIDTSYIAVGGGMYVFLGGVTAVNSTIDGNFAGCTDGLVCYAAEAGGVGHLGYGKALILTSSSLSNNTTSATHLVVGAGAMALANGAFHQINGSRVSGNQAVSANGQAEGGGVYLMGYPNLSGSTVSGNTADTGGGVFVYYGSLTVQDSTVSGNTAKNAGGIYNAHVSGYYGGNGPMTVRNSTVTANVATGSAATGGIGAGIVDTQTTFSSQFQSSIVAGNSAPNADASRADLIAFAGTVNGANNLVVAATGTTLPADTIQADPLLGPLRDNGGPTPTHALLFGSPAIDAGNNSANLTYDQRGEGYARVVGAVADIGAFENQQAFVSPLVAVSFAPDTIGRHGLSTLTVTITNSDDISGTLTADFVDTLPAAVVVANSAGASTTCPAGTVTAESGSGVIVLAGGAGLPAASSCVVTVSVTSADEGVYTNTIPAGALQTDLGNSVESAAADLTVVNTPPEAADDAYATAENTTLHVAAPGVLANDLDADGDTLSALLAVSPIHGVVAIAANGSFVYTPALDFVGTDSFTYLSSDGQASMAATVTIQVKQGTDEAIFADGFDGR